ncbi:protein NODULATION SIGNALING PATHWAY 2-like [Nicotiana tabacum]|uniref:Nodulation-signaling pathway 2 protein-like n=1 Tax=Nicotiana tabacum TaxID=4097 RepID=A0A1S4ATC0_TOBAC|nr:PREDICTED: nodulation-signaling pathway 2 protein-like [Nicotiana tabacum]
MMQSELLHTETEFCAIQIDQDSSGIAFSDLTSLFPDDVFTDLSMDDLEFDDFCKWLNDSESEEENGNMNISISCEMQKDGNLWSPAISGASRNSAISLVIPGNSKELDTQISLHHLLAAYGEAIENGHKELAEVIIRSIKGKINPLGESLERVASNLFLQIEDQEDYLKQESSKNLEVAFKVFYQIFPIGKFAHFAANSAIMESIPDDVETIHIVDFDMGEGIQWPPIIEAMCQRRKAMKLTSIKKTKEESTSDQWRFEDIKRRLLDYAKPFGLRLQIEEMTVEELASEMRRMKKRGNGNEWLVFNCMFKLPHMGKTRCRIHALEFLKLAKEMLLANSSTHRGLVTFGDGEAMDNSHNTNTFSTFFNKNLIYYQSIFESLELYFPAYLAEARLAMESLFLAPQVCSFSWFQNWEEIRNTCYSCGEIGLQGKRISKENLLQAKELVNERETPLKVRIEEQRQHEMVLEWKGTQLVSVSTWTRILSL